MIAAAGQIALEFLLAVCLLAYCNGRQKENSPQSQYVAAKNYLVAMGLDEAEVKNHGFDECPPHMPGSWYISLLEKVLMEM